MGFLKLPAELRNKIYYHVAVCDAPINTGLDDRQSKATHGMTVGYLPALASVCRKTSNEVLPIYFAKNHFHIGSAASREAHSLLLPHQWSRLAGNNAVHTRHMTLGHCDIPYSRGTVIDDADIEAQILSDGRMFLGLHWNHSGRQRQPPFCVCAFNMTLEASTFQNQDGRRILDFFERCEFKFETCLEADLCASCGLRNIFSR